MTQLKIYIPSVFRHSKAVNDFINAMLREFNGMTVYDALGYWINPETDKEFEKEFPNEPQLETETVKVYEFLTQNESLEDIRAIVSNECFKLKLSLNQKTVLYCIDNKPYFV